MVINLVLEDSPWIVGLKNGELEVKGSGSATRFWQSSIMGKRGLLLPVKNLEDE